MLFLVEVKKCPAIFRPFVDTGSGGGQEQHQSRDCPERKFFVPSRSSRSSKPALRSFAMSRQSHVTQNQNRSCFRIQEDCCQPFLFTIFRLDQCRIFPLCFILYRQCKANFLREYSTTHPCLCSSRKLMISIKYYRRTKLSYSDKAWLRSVPKFSVGPLHQVLCRYVYVPLRPLTKNLG